MQLMLGHASAAITLDVYADLFEDDLDDVGEALNNAALALAPQIVTFKASPRRIVPFEP